jgi:hypothetical protein
MNIKEAKKLCHENGIHQLNKGETLADVIDHIKNGTLRKGYKYLRDNGVPMSENEIISNENREAFRRSFTPPEFYEDEVEDIDDIPEENDLREDKTARGVIILCHYCGTCLRIDAGPDDVDYDVTIPEIHCEDCFSAAIYNLTM